MTPSLSNMLLQSRQAGLLVVAICMLAGCHRDMYGQPRYDPLEPSDFFDDGRSARPLPAGTVEFQSARTDDVFHTGKQNGELVEQLPVKLDQALLNRGRERFDIFCSVCHGRTGEGNGMIVQRGYRQPPTYHSERLRSARIGHFFDVITSGFGAMPSYAAQIPPDDRWAISAYVRALQFSQHAQLEHVPDAEREKLETRRAP